MLAVCEKRPMRAISNPVYNKRFAIVFALLCVLPVAADAQAGDTAQNPPAPLGKLVDVGGYRVHLYCTGAGSPTVVIVGAGFSFNWGLVQPEVAKITQVCSYDHSGIGWSDDGPKDSCALRVSEVHTALKNAGIKGPYVVVGHSLGALVARLYAGRYPDEVVGMVFVDHAMTIQNNMLMLPGVTLLPPRPSDATVPAPMSSTPRGGGTIESDPSFSKLSARDRELHLWAMAQTRNQMALQSNHEMVPECVEEADAITKGHSHPLGDKPLVDITTENSARATELQTKLLSLSQNSKQIIAEKSGHFIMIDRPDVVIDAVNQVVHENRNSAKLSGQ
jgi:pimeloyl-ACP methyl ester carboxylesterase